MTVFRPTMRMGAGSYGNDGPTQLLLHFNGADASTSFPDARGYGTPHAMTANGNVQIDTAQSVFGGASALFDGTGDYISTPDDAAWTPGTGFTADLRARFNSLATSNCLYSHFTDTNERYRLLAQSDGSLRFNVISGGVSIINVVSAGGVVTTATWYHIAFVKNGTDFRIYLDGTSVANTTTATAVPNFTGNMNIGMEFDGTSNPMNGWQDEFRISNIARWTAAFTVPNQQYS